MSIDVMTKVIQRAPLSGSRLSCLLIMASWCNDDGDSLYPSIALLSEAIRLTRSQTQRVLHSLMPATDDDEASGKWWVRVVANQKGGAPGMTRRYQINVARLDALAKLPEFQKAEDRRQKKSKTGRTHATGSTHATGRTHATPRAAPMRPDSSEDSSVERESARANGFEDFETARAAWPTGFTDKRGPALKAWNDLQPEDREAALSEIPRFVAEAKRQGRDHLPSFGRYLADRGWQALPARPRPAVKATGTSAATAAPSKPVKAKLTAFQLAHPELYPELFPDRQGTDRKAVKA
ncbi:hypothetical protein [Hoeflea alexandrii]